jgi:GT2 family glycosyltransferase
MTRGSRVRRGYYGTVRARIVVLNWNGKKYLHRCVAALLADAGDRAEVVVVDNGSTDGSVEFLRAAWPGVRVVALPRNVGFAAGNNAGARDATAEYLIFLNNDTEVASGWLTALLAAADAHGARGVIGSKVVFVQAQAGSPVLVDSAGDDYFRAGGATKSWHRRPADSAPGSREVFSACGAAMLVPRTIFTELGGFDERLFVIYEDVDLCYRARLRGYTVHYAADAVVHHVGSAALGRLSATAVFYGQRNLEWVWLQNTPGRLLWRSLPAHVAYSLAGALYYARQGHAWTWLRAKAAALAGLRATLVRRRAIQASTSVDPESLWSLMRPGWLSAKRAEKS